MKIQKNISLKNKNWFKTGGKTKYFCQPTNEHELKEALELARLKKLEIFVLGQGANILISDDGFDGLTIRPQIKDILIKNEYITAGAGVGVQELIDICLENNLIGLQEFSGIPGTVGGSVYINIHYFEYFLSDFLVKARVINQSTGEIKNVNKKWFGFGYDKSKLLNKKYFLLNATFKLDRVNELKTAYAKGQRDETIRHRIRRYPTGNTCGSFFRNFHENELSLKINGKKIPYVAYYLDKLGIKGELKIGGASVSHKHANMLVTLPNAKSSDVIKLAKKIQEMVFSKYGIIPQPECQFVGFRKIPLL